MTEVDVNKISEILKAVNAGEKRLDSPKIRDEFRDLLDDLSDTSNSELELSIKEDGVRDPIIVWLEEDVIVDGHNRFKIAAKLGVECPIKYKSFADDNAVRQWMLRNQLARRNLTPQRFEYYIGKLYNETKSVSKEKLEDGPTDEAIAKEHGVSPRTVRRAADTAIGIDIIERIKGKQAKQDQLSGKGEYKREELHEIAKVAKQAPERAPAMVKALDKIKKDKLKAPAPKPAKVETLYDVVFCEPDFTSAPPKPSLAKNSILAMAVDDEDMSNAIRLFDKWGVNYEASIVFQTDNGDKGIFSKIDHTMLVIGSKGIVTGPAKGKEKSSVQKVTSDVTDQMIKYLEGFVTGKKMDMRKGRKADGWE